jgi:hypothetical protein
VTLLQRGLGPVGERALPLPSGGLFGSIPLIFPDTAALRKNRSQAIDSCFGFTVGTAMEFIGN